MEVIHEKQQLRRQMIERLSSKSTSARAEESKMASQHCVNQLLEPLRLKLGRSLTVFSYISFGHELDTSAVIDNCLQSEDTVLVPRVASKTALQLHELHVGQELVVNKMGISEPNKLSTVWPAARYHELDLVIVPGLAYDSLGGRIGYGGGYYDRFITELRQDVAMAESSMPVLASLLFKEQLVDHVPIAHYDFRVDMLISGEQVLKI